jgi:signal transduction histidine kinase
MRSYPFFIVTTVFIFAALLLWVAITRYNDFVLHQTIVSQQLSNGVANQVALVINDKKRLVNLFANEQAGLLKFLASNPDSDEIHSHIEKRLRQYFPDYFVYTLADQNGAPYFEDFDGNMNEMCKADIIEYLHTGQNLPRIHPSPNAYHFDIMGSLPTLAGRNILLVSFHANTLTHLLANSQSPDHTLMLVMPGKQSLIEVTAQGARNKLDRLNYMMTETELSHVLSRKAVPGTNWEVVDLANPNLIPNYKNKLILQSLMIFIPFLLFSSITWYLFLRAWHLRRKAETARDEFLSTVSHELRTPLTAIHGSLGLVANGITGQISARSAELVNIAVKNSQRLILLVNDLLDMRKLESGKMNFDMKPINLVNVVRHAIDENRTFLQQHHTRCELITDKNQVVIYADQNRITQVMTNLLSNATKYGPENEPIEVRIDVRNGMVRVSVFDKGEVIPVEFRSHLFEKFTQLDSSDSRSSGGSGLGLSIVKAIIEAQGGKVGFTSYRDVGTTFYFELPLDPSGSAPAST